MDFSMLSVNSSSFQELLAMFASALGCGMLIGLERERSKQRENQHSFAGLRSFTICALLGAMCFLLGAAVGIAGAIIVGGMTVLSIKNQPEDPGITTELAFVMTYFIGAMCLWNAPLAAGLAVFLTVILMAKRSMHSIAGKWITEAEFRDGLFLLALILIALPLTPNTPLWGSALNPYIILKLLTLILAVQSLAHIAKRLLTSKNAMILSSIASGFVSSTAAVASLGMEVRSGRASAKANAGAALMSCVATLLQLLIIVAGVSMLWLKTIIIPTLIATVILACCAYWQLRNAAPAEQIPQADTRMFSLKEAGIIAATLTLIQAGVYGLNLWLGDAGLIAGTLLASLFEIHAAMATVVMQGSPAETAVFYAFILGLAAHAIAKSINALLTGGWQYFRVFAPVQILHMAVLISLLILYR
nr:MgtC/SapB family protein [Acinetobacter pragensis]